MMWRLTKEQEQLWRRIGRSPMRKPRAIHSHASHCRRCLLTSRCLVQTKPWDLSLAWLGWDCSLVLVTPSNPGLSSRPASHWQAPQHRESRGRSSPPLLPPLLQPSRPRSASRSPPPEDHVDHWVRIYFCKTSTCEQSTLNHQSQMKYCWLNRVPLGQRKVYLRRPPIPSLAQMWKVWQSASGSA